MQTVVFSGRFRPFGTRLAVVLLVLLQAAVFSGRFRPFGTRLTVVLLVLIQAAVFSGRFRPFGTRLAAVLLVLIQAAVFSGRFRPFGTRLAAVLGAIRSYGTLFTCYYFFVCFFDCTSFVRASGAHADCRVLGALPSLRDAP
ncbi:hypothetical protein [Paenibacillus agricola]|uniref:hypothetical protein n=1 Tax=Paenibacillus agricola TaxID=2716264 RepID=UPI001FB6F4F7|nr:hypothetical protein [Paenibacillus agricola]